ncbi:MAG: hypothetical protein ACYTGN_00650 [Planctomycetota bacterium]|jgi:chromosome segregation ATPase
MNQHQEEWLARRGGDDTSAVDKLRAQMEGLQAGQEGWTASFLSGIRDLLDAVETIGRERESDSERLAELEAERDQLAAAAASWKEQSSRIVELERQRDELRVTEAAAEERIRVLEKKLRHLEEAAGDSENLRDRLLKAEAAGEQAQRELADLKSHESEWDAALERVQAGQAEIEELRAALEKARRERDALAENVSTERVDAKLAEKVERLKRECEHVKRAHEESLVEACDLRVQVNRLENDIDKERDERRRKVKRVLAKVHSALDDAGAPTEDDMSFGERIRLLGEKKDKGDDTEPEFLELD